MKLAYKKATLAELDVLTAARLDVMRVVWQLDEGADMTVLKHETEAYYRDSLAGGGHAAYLAYDGGLLAATGGISFYRIMPTGDNPTGWKAYIMNMYTRPEYRRLGVATRMLDLLVREAQSRDIVMVALEASDAGRSLYLRYGFVPAADEMLLRLDKQGCMS